MSSFYEVSDETMERFNKIFKQLAFPVSINFQFIGNDKQKELIKIVKIPDNYAFLLDKEILVIVNEEYASKFDDDECLDILFEQEINKLYFDTEHDKLKFIKTDVNTYSGLINKYGAEKIVKANLAEQLYTEQREDEEKEQKNNKKK